jgi:adenine deaminase
MHLRGQIIDIPNERIFPGIIEIADGKITAIREDDTVTDPGYLCPGFIDAHVHIESSMLTPPEFARLAVIHGTVGTVSDPHEIANVLGLEGVRYMQQLAATTPCKIHFGIPSCVPATNFETAGANLGPDAVEELCRDESLLYLSEMMNFPGVIHADPEVLEKIAIAKKYGKHIDGHAPGLRGEDLKKYVAAGIETDHECFQIDEAREKLALGQKILIREGSAAKNFEELWPLLNEVPQSCMLCSDDKHPDDLIVGHINQLCARAIAHGVPLFNVLRAACVNPVEHYGLRCGLLRPGDPADLVRLHDLESFKVMETWIDGQCVARDGHSLLPKSRSPAPNKFFTTPKKPADFAIRAPATAVPTPTIRVIEALDGQIVTGAGEATPLLRDGSAIANPAQDILKITVVNRYSATPKGNGRPARLPHDITGGTPVPPDLPAVAFVRGIGLKQGAIASSVAHDCHNIVAVGTTDEDLARVVNLVISHRGGIAAVGPDGLEDILPLPVAGLMSDGYAEEAATGYARLTQIAKSLGSPLHAPYMTLSFLALLVIPALKLSDLGLFDGTQFEFVPVFVTDQSSDPLSS